ncbi:uncharacterized protein TRIVIDRAFT_44202 [Trichoderma virens Gv29-8]|uniref:2EXR domain-containing protein n=1 Tax=Hypocrea virens (strain Gv29-8 / FGSC 10586) TaxID=413071 RepID=G9N2R8_HYPVG|nr:uncharacterized protein TRIVIDRAFT_44202 [Trichoderma virens Gv29-8]EHK18980.1 hypothetical protein TRIVIDRAFT_44202 [Trichoderma virens Gv29-8]UKZ56754.1 hypothetical protein TrVGV298_010595 [Trichoderma virens]
MATTFHPFPRLPFELRSQIWAMAVYPRLVHIRATSKPSGPGCYFASMIPQAELMHVCRESRQLAPYRKAFFTTLPDDSEARYIWVNFDEDMICIPDQFMGYLRAHAADIQRLRFTAPAGSFGEGWVTGFGYAEYLKDRFKHFTALREVHVAISEDISSWVLTAGCYGTCPYENVRFLDVHSGLMLTIPQANLVEEWISRKGWLVENMDGIDEELQFYIDNCYTFIEDCAEVD